MKTLLFLILAIGARGDEFRPEMITRDRVVEIRVSTKQVRVETGTKFVNAKVLDKKQLSAFFESYARIEGMKPRAEKVWFEGDDCCYFIKLKDRPDWLGICFPSSESNQICKFESYAFDDGDFEYVASFSAGYYRVPELRLRAYAMFRQATKEPE